MQRGPASTGYPRGEAQRIAWAEQTGVDGQRLLTALYADVAPPGLRRLPAVEILRQVWVQIFMMQEGRLVWRDNGNTPPAGRYIGSPYDPDARLAHKKRSIGSATRST
jgi:hypothetical protein